MLLRVSLNLLVLRCESIQQSRLFYEKLGLKFKTEKHGAGPEHFSAEIDGWVLELYPLKASEEADNCRLGFAVTSFSELTSRLTQDENIEVVETEQEFNSRLVLVIKDPDGRRIEVSEASY